MRARGAGAHVGWRPLGRCWQAPGTFQGWRCGLGVVFVRCGEYLVARTGFAQELRVPDLPVG